VAPHVHVEQVTSRRARLPPRTPNANTKMDYGKCYDVFHCTFWFVFAFRGAGGGEVSGGGTLYMKWGAGLFGLRRECEARAGVKHTHTLIFTHHSLLRIHKNHPKKVLKYSEF
jgi:hypothetical protein